HRVSATSEGQSDVVAVKATDTNPRRAATVANTYAEQFLDFRRNADRAKVHEAQRVVEHELADVRGKGPIPGGNATLSPQQLDRLRQIRQLRARANQLALLSSLQTGGAELAERARVPSSPSSPKTTRNVVLGGIMGLLLG